MRATSVMLLFISKWYFVSKNCLREIRASLEQDKPLVLVHEQQEDKGGGPLEEIMNECHSQEMRTKIFVSRTPITWHRVPVCKTAMSGPASRCQRATWCTDGSPSGLGGSSCALLGCASCPCDDFRFDKQASETTGTSR